MRASGTAAIVLLLCAACDARDPGLSHYVVAIHRALELEGSGPEPFESRLRWYPDSRERTFELEENRLGLRDYLTLRECELDDLVAGRNTSLGRVMRESSRLVYEHRLLGRLERCRTRTDPSNAELLRVLDDLVASKRKQLPRVFWNATLGSREMASFFSRTADPLPLEAPGMPAGIPRAFAALKALSTTAHETTAGEIEQHYHVLQSRPYGGELLATMELASFYLDEAMRALSATSLSGTRCDALASVFRKHYVSAIQPYIAARHGEARRVLERVQDLEATAGVEPPPEFDSYSRTQLSMDASGSVWRRFESSIERHTGAWQAVFDHCGLQPQDIRSR